MKKLLFAITTILLMCACNNNNSTGIGSTFSEMDSLIENANKKMESGGVTNNFKCSAEMDSDTLFVTFERAGTKPSEHMNKIKNDTPAKNLVTKLILTYFYYVQFDENDFPYQALVNKVIKDNKYIGIKYLSLDGSWSDVISSTEMKDAININQEQRYEIIDKMFEISE